METTHNVAGIDVHKSMLAVVITDAAREGEFQFERRKFGATESELRQMAAWLTEHEVLEAVRRRRAAALLQDLIRFRTAKKNGRGDVEEEPREQRRA